MLEEKIPVTIITGFLGAGKTTLVNQILTQPHGRKIAVIINEFGEVGIDHELVIYDEEEIFETSNGCICCSVRGDLLRILEDLAQYKNKFDAIIIETTGLADPAPVAQTFFFDAEMRARYELDAVIAIVDAKNFSFSLENSSEAEKQIAFADKILLNKTDLVSDEEKFILEEKIRSLNPLAEIFFTQNSEVGLDKILDTNEFSFERALKNFSAENHSHSEISSVSFVLDEPLDKEKFSLWLTKLTQERGEEIFRYKGIVNFAGEKKKFVLQGMHMMFEIEPQRLWIPDENRQTKIVFIGKNLGAIQIHEKMLS